MIKSSFKKEMKRRITGLAAAALAITAVQAGSTAVFADSINHLRIDIADDENEQNSPELGLKVPCDLESYSITWEDGIERLISLESVAWRWEDENGEINTAMAGDRFEPGDWHMEINFSDPDDLLPKKGESNLDIEIGDDDEWVEVSGGWSYVSGNGEEKRFASPTFQLSPLSGSCGEDASWEFIRKTGKLKINGSGPMTDFGSSSMPWSGLQDKIKAVVIGEGITHVGESSFESCDALETVSFPSTLLTIGESAFSDCGALTEVSLPAALTTIGTEAFSGCEALGRVTLPEKKTALEKIENGAFSECVSLKELNMPASVKELGDGAFESCTGLTEVLLPFHLALIDEKAVFSNCGAKVYFDLKGASVDNIVDKTYTGKEITQSPVVGDSDVLILKKNKGYTLSYSNNTDAGTATVTITGKGRYQGELKRTFTIKKASMKTNKEIAFDEIPDAKYTGEAITPDVTVTFYGEALTEGKDYTVRYSKNTAVGDAVVSVKGKGNFKGTAKKTFRIVKYLDSERIPMEEAEIGEIGKLVYTGKKQKPQVEVSVDGTVLKKGRDYKLSYKANKKIGTASVTVTGKGRYKGTQTKTFQIVPKGTKLKKLVGQKKKILVRWKKQAKQTTGYQIEYSADETFASGSKRKRITDPAKTSYTIKKLKRKKLYYVRIRTYKKVGKKRYYSKWSKPKMIRTI